MKDKDLKYFKNILQDQLNQLLSRADKTFADLIARPENSSEIVDLAQAEIDRGFMLRIRERERHLIAKILLALQNIEDGTFGICEECGEEIAVQRLKARPVTTFCIECKERKETLERLQSGSREAQYLSSVRTLKRYA